MNHQYLRFIPVNHVNPVSYFDFCWSGEGCLT